MKYDVTISVWGHTFRVKNVEAPSIEVAMSNAYRAFMKDIRTDASPTTPTVPPKSKLEKQLHKMLFGK